MTRGLFITFEGIDGCGKSTQLRLLADHLQAASLPVIVTREPGGTALGQSVRALLLSASQVVSPIAELLLFAADRAQHVAEVIQPALDRGCIVLCDRFDDSTTCYQAVGRGLDMKLVTSLQPIATGGINPDLTLLFDLEPGIAWQRISRRAEEMAATIEDRFERAAMEFHQRVRQAYLDLSARAPARIKVVSSLGTPENIHQTVIRLTEQFFSLTQAARGKAK